MLCRRMKGCDNLCVNTEIGSGLRSLRSFAPIKEASRWVCEEGEWFVVEGTERNGAGCFVLCSTLCVLCWVCGVEGIGKFVGG